jgi:hypothetical protein
MIDRLAASAPSAKEEWSDLFHAVYCAFDAGEYYHKNDQRNVDPVETYTRPEITRILSRAFNHLLPGRLGSEATREGCDSTPGYDRRRGPTPEPDV